MSLCETVVDYKLRAGVPLKHFQQWWQLLIVVVYMEDESGRRVSKAAL